MQKILEYILPNQIMAYKPYDALCTGILLTNKNAYGELFTNFMNFTVRRSEIKGKIHMDVLMDGDFSYIAQKHIPYILIADKIPRITDFIINAIDHKYYVKLPVETKYISNYINYKIYSNCHSILLFGYDSSRKVFIGADFFRYASGQYSIQEISFQEIEIAFNYLQTRKGMDDPAVLYEEWRRDIFLIKKVDGYAYHLTPQKLIMDIQFFLNGMSRTGNKNWISELYYGMDIYPLLKEYILQQKKNEKKVDIRVVSVLFYHYRFMQRQIDYVASLIKTDCNSSFPELSEISKGYKLLEENANASLHLIMKYNVMPDQNILQKMAEIICFYSENEKNNLLRYYYFLNNLSVDDCLDKDIKEQNHLYL